MTATIKVEGIEDVLRAFDRLGAAGHREGKRAVRASLEKVRGDAIKSIQRGTKSGRVYERAGEANLSATHQASAPGEAPATDTGALVGSIQVTQQGMAGQVATKLEYGFWLEYGTLQMAERPFLRPALAENQQYIIDQFARAIRQAVQEFNQ